MNTSNQEGVRQMNPSNIRPTDRLTKKAKAIFDTLPISERRSIVVALAGNWSEFVSDNVKIRGNTIYMTDGNGEEQVFQLKGVA
jgi:hypothetical protein